MAFQWGSEDGKMVRTKNHSLNQCIEFILLQKKAELGPTTHFVLHSTNHLPKPKIYTICKITPKKILTATISLHHCFHLSFQHFVPYQPLLPHPLPHNPLIGALHKVRFKLCEVVLCEVMSHQCDYSLLDILSFSMFNLTWCGLNLSSCKIAF